MRFMVIVKASEESEAGVLPEDELFSAMGKYNEELMKAGVILAADLFVLALVQRATSQHVDRASLRRSHQPSGRVVGHARLGPVFERGDERVLREFFREPYVAHDAREAGDEFRRLDSPDRFDRAVCVGGCHGDSLQPAHRAVEDGGLLLRL